MKEKNESDSVAKWAAGIIVGNVAVGAAVITALIVLKSGLALLGFFALPSLWAVVTVGGDKDDKKND